MTASLTSLPVLGVPMKTKALEGKDSLLSIVQMPAGIPVGTLAIGKPGAINAALLAAAVLALSDAALAQAPRRLARAPDRGGRQAAARTEASCERVLAPGLDHRHSRRRPARPHAGARRRAARLQVPRALRRARIRPPSTSCTG